MATRPETHHQIKLTVNGRPATAEVDARQHLADFLRDDLGLFGTRLGCEHGVCGACTILLDDQPVRSCLMLAVQVDGAEITTVEGIANDSELHPLQRAFETYHGVQCGFCTSGMLVTSLYLLGQNPDIEDGTEIRAALSGNLCRCTGYQNIIAAVQAAAAELRDNGGGPR